MRDAPGMLNATTVKLLQSHAFTMSTKDAEYINKIFADRLIFTDVDDDIQKNFRARVLCIEYIIPSLHTFHEDIKYLKSMTKLVRTLLTLKYKGSVQDGMKRRYRGPATDDCYIQTSETEYHWKT
ncbi:hypothetical protein AJ78_08568 [Emergomyces pasteurianus Ep9510]|uniref:Uncharacterized protein n=1 Tax=Emergomyces pasteurianus Ep9510 TaxID=1447872 RepID=A0A1J9P3F6_9EURO|nr:hypothetical protein AJ78_08568 [Emergomyces pasteurianus Ep9510]